MSGTAHYLAPEILSDRDGSVGHTRAVDWWSYGVIVHLLLTLQAPFWSDSYAKLFELILTQEIDWTAEMYAHLSPEAISLLDGLLAKDPQRRLDGAAIKSHRFFKRMPWRRLADFRSPPFPPLRPDLVAETPLEPSYSLFRDATSSASSSSNASSSSSSSSEVYVEPDADFSDFDQASKPE
jgi:serine/threonine protein kinase